MSLTSEPRIQIDYDGDCTCRNDHADGELDEFVLHNATIHFEMMDAAQFWIGITGPDGRRWAINCGAVNPNVKGYSRLEEDG